MPYCETNNGARIFYRRYGHGSTKVLFIVGLACTHSAWGPQLKGLAGTAKPNEEGVPEGTDEEGQQGIEACSFDNRGMGRSSIPSNTSDYTTTIMAKDAVALLDHLGWKKAHVIGHSMGAMIACKLAAIAPDRLCSLALLNATGGGFECIPKLDRQMISLFYRLLRAKTPEQRADVDLETHYSKEYLDEYIGTRTRRHVLYEQYVKSISSSGMQSSCGFEGQIKACWNHKLTAKELDTMRSSGFLISVIHGRYDIVAQLYYARRLAEKLRPAARMVEIHGGHLVSRERPDEVNEALLQLIQATNSNLKPEDWSNLPENLPENSSGWCKLRMPISFSIRSNEGASSFMTFYTLLGKLQLGFLYFIGVFVMAFQYMMNAVKLMKPARVVASETRG